jgi:transcriptional regulator with XRE-family HTH domain
MTKRTWGDIKKGRLTSEAGRAGYERARRAFELGERVRHIREERGLSQRELAEMIGSTQPAIARLDAGGVAPSIPTLERIAATLGRELVVDFANPPSGSGGASPGGSLPDCRGRPGDDTRKDDQWAGPSVKVYIDPICDEELLTETVIDVLARHIGWRARSGPRRLNGP